MKKTWRKNIAFLLVIAMMLTIMPVTVFAEGEERSPETATFTLNEAIEDGFTVDENVPFNVQVNATTNSAVEVQWTVGETVEAETSNIVDDVATRSFENGLNETTTITATFLDSEEKPIVDENDEVISVSAVFYVTSEKKNVKKIKVDASTEMIEGMSYTTIQQAINYIAAQEDKENWTIDVVKGEYNRFTILDGLNGLTVKADGDVMINVVNDSEAPTEISGGYPDTAGVSIRYANNVILDGLIFNVGIQDSPWYSAAVSNYSESGNKSNNFEIKNCKFLGCGSGIGVFINTGTTEFMVQNCSFNDLNEAISMYGDGTLMEEAAVTDNVFTNCSFAIHGYYGGSGNAGVLTFADNTMIGKNDLYTKVVIQDQCNTSAIRANVRGNKLTNAIIGLVNLREDGENISPVLDNNTFNENSFYVEAIEPGTISFYASYQAPTNEDGKWVLTGKENFDVDWGKNPDGSTAMIEEIVAAANASGSKTLNITGIDENNLIKTFTWFKDGIYWETNNSPISPDEPEIIDWEKSKSKTATNLDTNFESRVTLSLPSASYKGNLDVAFVLDGSTSADEKELTTQAANLLDELSKMENLNVKASLTIFGGSEAILEDTELLDISDEKNIQDLKTKLIDPSYDKRNGRSGSNLQAGVEIANRHLNNDKMVDNEDKYMIILSDGAARMWYENNQAMSQTYSPSGTIFWNSNEDFIQRYDSEGVALRTFEEVWAAGKSGVMIGAYGMSEKEKNEATIENEKVASWDIVTAGTDYYTTYEAATYYAATSIVKAANDANIIFISYPYHTGENYGTYTESFKSWLAENKIVTRYDNADLNEREIFSAVKDKLIYLVDAGSKVVDVIGYDDTYNNGIGYHFDFLNDIDKLNLTVNGTTLSAIQLSTIDNETVYGFGSENGSKDGKNYPYVLHYYPNGTDSEKDEHFVWEINVPIKVNEPVQLTYSVKLTDPTNIAGNYNGLETNKVATLYPIDSNGNNGEAEEFNKPTVSYTVTKKPADPEDPWTPSNPDPEDPDIDIEDPDVPLTEPEEPEEPTIIEEPDVPLVDVPGEPVVEVEEPEVPLGDAPKTGDVAPIAVFVGLVVVGVGGLIITRRKFN